LVLALKENLEDTNEKVENWLEVMANKDSIAETADRADEAVLARSKYEQQMLFEEMRQNRNAGTAMA
jgi:5-bromo-4-chloroindolyl phosphate hydrolysis protein